MNRDQAHKLSGLALDISEASSVCGAARRTLENLEKILPNWYVKSKDAVLDEAREELYKAQTKRAECWEIYHKYAKELTEDSL